MAENLGFETGHRNSDEFGDFRYLFQKNLEAAGGWGRPVHMQLVGPADRITTILEHCDEAGMRFGEDFNAWQHAQDSSLYCMYVRAGIGTYYPESERYSDTGGGSADVFTFLPIVDDNMTGQEIYVEASYLISMVPISNEAMSSGDTSEDPTTEVRRSSHS